MSARNGSIAVQLTPLDHGFRARIFMGFRDSPATRLDDILDCSPLNAVYNQRSLTAVCSFHGSVRFDHGLDFAVYQKALGSVVSSSLRRAQNAIRPRDRHRDACHVIPRWSRFLPFVERSQFLV